MPRLTATRTCLAVLSLMVLPAAPPAHVLAAAPTPLTPAFSVEGHEAHFVRGGLVVATTVPLRMTRVVGGSREPLAAEARALPGGRQWLEFSWQPGERFEVELTPRQPESNATPTSFSSRTNGKGATRLTAPLVPWPCAVAQISLENVDRVALTGATPDSVVAFAPDSRRVAVGSFLGQLRLVDAYSGRIVHRQSIPEGLAKRLAWSPDGQTLYVGEQSPDARLTALAVDGATAACRILWSMRLADAVETSRPPAGDRYAVYSLPFIADLKVAADGRVFVAAAHSWADAGNLRNRSAVACFRPDGGKLWQVPPSGGLPFVVNSLAIDREGERVAFFTGQSQPRASVPPWHPERLYLLDGRDGRIAGHFAPEPARPAFNRVESWDSIDLAADGSRAVLGLVDGRALLVATDEQPLRLVRRFDLAPPRTIGRTPIAAAASYCRIFGAYVVLQTQNTHIPFASAQAAHHAPAPHPGANSLLVADFDGKVAWAFRGPHCLTGNWTDRPKCSTTRWLWTLCRERPGAVDPPLYGGLLFDFRRRGAGFERLVYHYPTVGPAGFSGDVSPDGRLFAVVEVPAPLPNGRDVYGTHQLHLVH